MRELKKAIWPHKVTIKTSDRSNAAEASIIFVNWLEETMGSVNWLEETMGIYNGRWNFIVRSTSADFYFKDGKDAVLFTLRWI